MSQLFRKEAMDHRSRALFGEVVLRGPLPLWGVLGLAGLTALVVLGILFGIEVDGQSVWTWLRG